MELEGEYFQVSGNGIIHFTKVKSRVVHFSTGQVLIRSKFYGSSVNPNRFSIHRRIEFKEGIIRFFAYLGLRYHIIGKPYFYRLRPGNQTGRKGGDEFP